MTTAASLAPPLTHAVLEARFRAAQPTLAAALAGPCDAAVALAAAAGVGEAVRRLRCVQAATLGGGKLSLGDPLALAFEFRDLGLLDPDTFNNVLALFTLRNRLADHFGPTNGPAVGFDHPSAAPLVGLLVPLGGWAAVAIDPPATAADVVRVAAMSTAEAIDAACARLMAAEPPRRRTAAG